MTTIMNHFGYTTDVIYDWNYIKGLSYILVNESTSNQFIDFYPPTPSISEAEVELRKEAHYNGYTGVMNQTYYEVESKPYVNKWVYLAGGIGISIVFFFASVGTIITRNYY